MLSSRAWPKTFQPSSPFNPLHSERSLLTVRSGTGGIQKGVAFANLHVRKPDAGRWQPVMRGLPSIFNEKLVFKGEVSC
jgi:hypothetical protein